jgi:hypothetical protein
LRSTFATLQHRHETLETFLQNIWNTENIPCNIHRNLFAASISASTPHPWPHQGGAAGVGRAHPPPNRVPRRTPVSQSLRRSPVPPRRGADDARLPPPRRGGAAMCSSPAPRRRGGRGMVAVSSAPCHRELFAVVASPRRGLLELPPVGEVGSASIRGRAQAAPPHLWWRRGPSAREWWSKM